MSRKIKEKLVCSRSIDISSEIAEQIRDMIGRGAFSPGVHLIPARIAEEIQELALRGALAPPVNFGTGMILEQFSASRMQAQIEKLGASFEHTSVAQSLYAVRDFHRMIFELSPKKVLMREAMRFWTLCDRYSSLLISSHSMHSMDTAVHLMDALTRQDRELLLKKFADDLHTIENDLIQILAARGL